MELPSHLIYTPEPDLSKADGVAYAFFDKESAP